MRGRKTTAAAVAVACALALASCGTTRIVANDPGARIYVNGAYVGQGQAEIDRRGPPRRADVSVQTADGRSERTTIKRRFTGTTFLLGFATYMVGWATFWEYPETVHVVLPAPAPGHGERPAAGWDQGGDGDVWMRPPPGWAPPQAPGQAPAQAPAAPSGQQPPPPEAPNGQPDQGSSPWQ